MEKKDTLSSCSDSEIQQMQLIQDKSKESCMVSFQRLHSHLKCLSNNDLKGSRTEEGFKRAFATLFGQDLETFTGTMFLYMDQLQKHMTGNLKLLCNFVEKFLGTVRFGNDQFAPILGYGDLVQGNVTIKRVYYVEGLNHNLFSVAFRKSTCFVRDLQGNDLLTGNHGSDLYTISLQETTSSTQSISWLKLHQL
ncbi:hypothetical protein Tco_1276532, partial [Tanacetum coccineum]